MSDRIEVAVVGGGVVGAAIFAEIARSGREAWLLERHARLATETTARNSGVVHAGLHYPLGSKKTRLCIEGARALYDWCQTREVPFRRTGKLIVATGPEEVVELERLLAHGREAGVEGLELVGAEAIAALEPEARGVAALHAKSSGIVDPIAFTESLAAAGESDGGLVLRGAHVRVVERAGDGWRLDTSRGEVLASVVVNAAGFGARAIAASAGLPSPPVFACRGDYYRIRGARRFQRLVYPVRGHRAAGLGVHLTIDLHGGARLGPDVTWIDDPNDVGPPAIDRREAFATAARRILRGVDAEDLEWDGAGVRPKLRAPTDPDERDFEIRADGPGFIDLFGIESPGLTSSLAIAREVSHLVDRC